MVGDVAQIQLPAAYELIMAGEVDDLRQYAADLAAQGAGEGTIIFAENQRSPKGVHNKQWFTYPDNLNGAILLEPEIEPDRYHEMLYVGLVSLGNAVAAHVAPMTSLGYGWPNDLRIAGNKIGSIWLDTGIRDSMPWIVITSSVNVRHGPEDFSLPAMSIHEAEGSSELSAPELLESWAKQFITQINHWAERGFSHTLGGWRVRAEYVGEDVNLQRNGRQIEGQCRAITEQGEMEVQEKQGTIVKMSVKEYMGW